jgi:hypothetical protein
MATRIWGLSKDSANYETARQAEIRCDNCMYMFPRLTIGGCRLVRGLIRGSATCDKFTPRSTSGS